MEDFGGALNFCGVQFSFCQIGRTNQTSRLVLLTPSTFRLPPSIFHLPPYNQMLLRQPSPSESLGTSLNFKDPCHQFEIKSRSPRSLLSTSTYIPPINPLDPTSLEFSSFSKSKGIPNPLVQLHEISFLLPSLSFILLPFLQGLLSNSNSISTLNLCTDYLILFLLSYYLYKIITGNNLQKNNLIYLSFII